MTDSAFTVEGKIPIPPDGRKNINECIYPFAAMKPGDSFAAPMDMGKREGGKDKRQQSIIGSARRWANKHSPNSVFITRQMEDGTVRCWRLS